MPVVLKDPNRQIPNGAYYFVAETNWDSRVTVGKFASINRIANALVAHRLGNMHLVQKYGWSIDLKQVEKEVQQFCAQVCVAMGYTDFIVSDVPIPKAQPPQPPPRVAGPAAGVVSKTGAAIQLIKDWLGDGLKPVEKSLAEKRAWNCGVREDGKGCPFNAEGGFFEKIGAIAAQNLKTLVAVKNEMQLTTRYDTALKSCLVCSCHMPVKVWVPLKHVLSNTTPEQMKELDDRCWIKTSDQ